MCEASIKLEIFLKQLKKITFQLFYILFLIDFVYCFNWFFGLDVVMAHQSEVSKKISEPEICLN